METREQMIVDNNGKQLSPCICSKAKYAFGLKSTKPKNTVNCSKEYWERTIRAISKVRPNKFTEAEITKAVKLHSSIFGKK